MHVYNRGADGQDIFSLPGDHDFFEQRMGESALECEVEVHAFALMTNHFHLLLHAPGEQVGEMMHLLCGEYASRYNALTGRSGPLFTGRFGSVPIMDEQQQFISARYIHRNPLGIVAPAALQAYRFSSLGVYLGRRQRPDWLVTDELKQIDDARHLIEDVADSHPVDRYPLESVGPARRTSFDELLEAIEAAQASRTTLMTVAMELRVGSTVEIAERFGITSDAVRRSARRGRVRLATDPGFQREHREVLARLDAA